MAGIIIVIFPAGYLRPPSPEKDAPRAGGDGQGRKAWARQLRSRMSRSRRCLAAGNPDGQDLPPAPAASAPGRGEARPWSGIGGGGLIIRTSTAARRVRSRRGLGDARREQPGDELRPRPRPPTPPQQRPVPGSPGRGGPGNSGAGGGLGGALRRVIPTVRSRVRACNRRVRARWGRIIQVSPAADLRPPWAEKNAPRADSEDNARSGRAHQLRSRRSRRCSSGEISATESFHRPHPRPRSQGVAAVGRDGGGADHHQEFTPDYRRPPSPEKTPPGPILQPRSRRGGSAMVGAGDPDNQALPPASAATPSVPESRGRGVERWGNEGGRSSCISPADYRRPPWPKKPPPGPMAMAKGGRRGPGSSGAAEGLGDAERPLPGDQPPPWPGPPPRPPHPRPRSRRVAGVQREGGGPAHRQDLPRCPAAPEPEKVSAKLLDGIPPAKTSHPAPAAMPPGLGRRESRL